MEPKPYQIVKNGQFLPLRTSKAEIGGDESVWRKFIKFAMKGCDEYDRVLKKIWPYFFTFTERSRRDRLRQRDPQRRNMVNKRNCVTIAVLL